MTKAYNTNMPSIEEIERTVLALPLEQRVLLAESLLGSLPVEPSKVSEMEELEQAERRHQEIESGKVKPLTEEEFWQSIEGRGEP